MKWRDDQVFQSKSLYGNSNASADPEHVLRQLDPFIKKRARESSRPNERLDRAQDLRVCVLKGLPKHNPAKATPVGFGAMLVDRGHVSLNRKACAAKRTPPSPVTSLNNLASPALVHNWEELDRHIDIQGVLDRLEPRSQQRILAETLMREGTLVSTARALGTGLDMVRRQRDELQKIFLDAGLDVYLK